MPWARAVVNHQLGAALIDFWALTPLEHAALAKASRNEKTESEERAEEISNQRQIAAAMRAAFPQT